MSQPDEPQIIPPDEAKTILRGAIAEKLGDDWEQNKWVVVTNTSYMARLNKGRTNVDFYVDYFSGEVTVETSAVDLGQETGKLFAWMMLGLFAVITVLLARGLGFI